MLRRRIGALVAAAAVAAAAGSYGVLAATAGCGADVCVGDSWQAAYEAAAPGQVLTVESGQHPGQQLAYDATKPTAADRVVFEASGATVAYLEMRGTQHAEFRGLTIAGSWNVRPSTGNSWTSASKAPADLVFDGIAAKVFLWRNVQNLTLRNSVIGEQNVSASGLGVPKIGAYPADSGTVTPSTDVLVENVTFRDIIRTVTGSTHAECLFLDAGIDGLTIRGSTFTNCGVFDIFGGGQTADRPIKNVLIEGNLLDASRDQTGGVAGSTFNIKGGASNFTFRRNSILGGGGTLRNDSDAYPGFVFERNAIQNKSFGWIGPATWSGNVMSAPAPGQQQAADVGFTSWSLAPCDVKACYRNDLHVIADSPAGRGDAGVPATAPPPPPPPTTTEPPPTTTEPPPPTTTVPPSCAAGTLELHKIAEDATTVTLGWAARTDTDDYVFYVDGTRVSWSDDGTLTRARFAKGAKCYGVDARGSVASGEIAG